MIGYMDQDEGVSQGVTACHAQGFSLGTAVLLRSDARWGGLWCDRLFAHIDVPRDAVGVVVAPPFDGGAGRPVVEVLWGGEVVTVFTDRLDPIGGAA